MRHSSPVTSLDESSATLKWRESDFYIFIKVCKCDLFFAEFKTMSLFCGFDPTQANST
jgi:hypothetical protein